MRIVIALLALVLSLAADASEKRFALVNGNFLYVRAVSG